MIDPACFRPARLASVPVNRLLFYPSLSLPGFCLPDFNDLRSFVFVDYKGPVYIPRELFCGLFCCWDLHPAVSVQISVQ